ncbi:MAG: hypothetical protein JW984_15075 [Deltaproteobacteria bacterium]|uniref:Uncharacterized protein n=1 Tax=Candidatus Zymogenus saltonus TaxID=2844893 RepID=A0A9D8PS09_9DELT|nr:hypothetical protein [Candidatus Zymogenus saltonus]
MTQREFIDPKREETVMEFLEFDIGLLELFCGEELSEKDIERLEALEKEEDYFEEEGRSQKER